MSKRDNDRLKAIRKMICCECGRAAPSQAAHSNFSIHGKGRGIKASDEYVIPLCHKHHHQFDTYSMGMNREQSIEWFLRKLERTNRNLAWVEREAERNGVDF